MAKVKYYAKENSSIGTHSFYAVPIPNGTLTFDELLDEAMDGKSVEPSIAKACVTEFMKAVKRNGLKCRTTHHGQRRMNGKALEELARLLPTPTAIEGYKYTNTWNPNSQMGQSLSAMAGSGMLPTPTARDWKGETNPGVRKEGSGCIYGDTLPDTVMREAKKQDSVGGQSSRLSPLFTEEMMGFPFLWTTLPFLSQNGETNPSKPTATPSSPK